MSPYLGLPQCLVWFSHWRRAGVWKTKPYLTFTHGDPARLPQAKEPQGLQDKLSCRCRSQALLFGLHTFVRVLSPGVDAARTAWHDRDSLASAAGLLECCSGHRGPTRLFPMTPECRGEGTIQAAATWRITASATVSCGDLACGGRERPVGLAQPGART